MELIEIPAVKKSWEGPTTALAVVIYGMWFALTYWHEKLPFWVLLPMGGWTVAWHMSLQHEIIHGHPTRTRWLNDLIGAWPLALWLPYEVYRRTHLKHHDDSRLTDPLDDPESYYFTREQWDGLGALGHWIVRAQSTLLGRIIIGPIWAMGRFWWTEISAFSRGDMGRVEPLSRYFLELAVVLVWVFGVCRMPVATYLVCFVYAGTGLALIRSFAEHRAAQAAERRTAIVEGSWILGPLFLFNNLHVAHHMRVAMPWYQLPLWYRLNREALIERNGGLLYQGYFDVARRYLLRPHDRPVHPFGPNRPA